MKSTVSTTQTFKYILMFTLIFSAFIALTITYNRAYKIKNETISILEKYEGVTTKSLSLINNYLKHSNYTEKGLCEEDEYGVLSLDSTTYKLVKSNNRNEKFYYCLSNYKTKDENKEKIFYTVKIFYKFNLPFLGDLMTFKITGETKGIKYYNKNQELKG